MNRLTKVITSFVLVCFLFGVGVVVVRAQHEPEFPTISGGDGNDTKCNEDDECPYGNSCPAPCGQVAGGTYCSQAYYPDCTCNCWEYCCTVCAPGDCTGGPTATPQPTATGSPGNTSTPANTATPGGPTASEPSPTATPTVSTFPVCEIELSPDAFTLGISELGQVVVTVITAQNGDFEGVRFETNDAVVASVAPLTDVGAPYTSVVSGNAAGIATITAYGIMNGEDTCVDSSIVTVGGTCSITVPDVSLSGVGDAADVIVQIVGEDPPGGIDIVDFVSSDTGVATVTTPDDTPAFTTTVTAQALGSTTYTATATMQDGFSTCFATGNIEVTNPDPWCQIKEGGVTTNGSVFSDLSAGCDPAFGCDPVFITTDVGDDPGVVSYGGTYGTGEVSTTDWEAAGDVYPAGAEVFDYDFFDAKLTETIRSGMTPTAANIPAGFFPNNGSPVDGYFWYYHNGDVIINSQDLGYRPTVLFVENGSVTINGPINVDDGQGFFAVITDGNISLGQVFDNGADPELEGVYIANGDFVTGSFDEPLWLRGMVAVQGEVVMEHNLPDNSQTPAELFDYGYDQFMLFPDVLMSQGIDWKEVAP